MRKRILNIKRPAGMNRRVMALSLSAIVLFSSCSFINNSKKVEKVAEDTPWFDSEVTKADLGLDLSRDLEKHQILTAGCDDKYTVIVLSGFYRPQEEEEEGDCILNVVVIDRVQKTVEKLDLSDRVSETENIIDAFYSNGKLTLMMNKSNPDTYETSQIEEDIDIRSGEVVETRPLGEPIESVFTIGEYRINVLKKGPFDKPYYVLTWNTSDGEGKEVTIKEKDTILNGIPVIIPMTESQVLVPVNTERETLYYEVDLKGEKLTPADPKDYDWLDIDHMKTYCFGSDLKTYFIEDNSGIKCIDLVNKKVENYVDFNWCGVNRSLIANSNIVSIDGDSVLLGGQKRGNYFMATDVVKAMSEYYLVKITKADKNPHAGKTVLTLYMDDEMAEEEVNDAVITFNNTNDGYYIKETYKYVKDYTELYEAQSDDELNLAKLNMNIDVTDQLTQDIINGKGPDILINTNDLGILNNENYLADLSPYFSDLDPSNYYTNIVEASRFGGKLYQMPVSLRIVGIGANHKYGGKSDIGFTFEEYKDFVNGTLNGRDPLGKGRIRYFCDLFNAMSDRFIKDGKADLSCPEFAELANYVKDNVQDKDDSREDEEYDPAPSDVRSSSIYCFGLSSYFEELWNYDGDFEIFGYPSADGRGPQSEAWISAAVSSQTVNVDACADFVKLLLSDEIQKGLAEKDYIVLNRLAFRENGIQAAEFFSGRGANRLIWNGYSSPKDHLKYTEKDIDELEKIIMSCSKNSSEDPAITIILQEEMPAFFLGQKDLDSVIRVAQNRVQTLLDERGSKGKSSIAKNNDSEESPVS
ncbi:MAG: extracellular solute-binding protein [Clostridiales bacterium]|nr:extracellular solute-binding protein [Clostridiales bacterium]